jgi:mycothiol system anti-sigma-R factor
MECIKVEQSLHHYLDGEVGRIRRVAISRHLATCAACSSGFAFEAHLRQTIVAKAREDAPDELRDRILRAIEETPLAGEEFTAPPSFPAE